jgi:hypothetical protein
MSGSNTKTLTTKGNYAYIKDDIPTALPYHHLPITLIYMILKALGSITKSQNHMHLKIYWVQQLPRILEPLC